MDAPRRRGGGFGGLALLLLAGCGTTLAEVQTWSRACDAKALVDGLAQERSWIREASAAGAGRCRLAEARPALEGRVSDIHEARWVRASAARALGALGAGPSLPLLVGLAADPTLEPEIQLAVIDALGSEPPLGPEACAALEPLGRSDEPLVAARARLALAAGPSCGGDG